MPHLLSMRIALAHNYYGSSAPSGENTVFEAECAALNKYHPSEVARLTADNDTLRSAGWRGKLAGACGAVWNPMSWVRVQRTLERGSFDVLHVHNTFPRFSPAIFHAAARSSAAVVATLHNFRLLCAGGLLLRRGAPCTECADGSTVMPALRHRCYRNSLPATVPVAAMIATHNVLGTWRKCVDAFIALSDFQKDVFVRAGLPSELIHVKGNFCTAVDKPLPWDQRENTVLFAGRLASYKGLAVLIDAWKMWGTAAPSLRIIGDGPERTTLERACSSNNVNVQFLGAQDTATTRKLISTSRLLVLPSVCYEGFPMTIIEAFSAGVPVVASRMGAIPSIVENGKSGAIVDPSDASALLSAIQRIWMSPGTHEAMSSAAHTRFIENYTAEQHYKRVIEVYTAAREARTRRLH